MKNCVLPLSAAYIDPDGVILEILHPLEPGNTNPVVAFTNRIQYVLETRQGWFQRHNVREGMATHETRFLPTDLLRQAVGPPSPRRGRTREVNRFI